MSATALAEEAAAATQDLEGRRASSHDAVLLHLLSSFSLEQSGESLELPFGVQRLVVFLSLQAHPLQRQHVAGTLWPETTDQKAAANLRSALWRLNQLGCPVVRVVGTALQLAPDVSVDLRRRTALAQRVLRDGADAEQVDPAMFCFDLLPDWYDDWLVIERERFHQLRLRALESLCQRLTERRRYDLAVEAGLAAVAAEPLRESAHRALVKVYLSEGNRADAVRQYNLYNQLVRDELGFAPSPQFGELLAF